MSKVEQGVVRSFRPAVRRRVTVDFDPVKEPSMTKQSFVDECSIHTIMAKYQATGIMPSGDRVALSGDFSDVRDYQSALEQVFVAQETFAALPSVVRDRFSNDPAKFLAFATDPKNGAEMVRLGLAVERKVDAPSPAKPDGSSGKA